MSKRIRIATIIVVLGAAILVGIISNNINHGAGVIIGGCSGLIGFALIERFSDRIINQRGGNGMWAYYFRLLVYGLIITLSMMKGIAILAILGGMMLHKMCVIWVGIRYKEDE